MAIGDHRRERSPRSRRQRGRARRRPKRRCASACAAAAARASPTSSSGRTGAARASDKVLRVRRTAGARVRRPEEPPLPRRLELDYETTLMGHGLQVQEPEREGRVRLRRERPVLRRVMICWSCQRTPDGRSARVRHDAAARRRGDHFDVLGLPRALRPRPGGARAALPRAVAAAASRPLRDAPTRARGARRWRAPSQLNEAYRTLQGSGAARRVPAAAARASTSAARRRRRRRSEPMPMPPSS